MKNLLSIERRLLKRLSDNLFPAIPSFVSPPKIEKQKQRIGLLRYNYRGEVNYFTPLLKYMDPAIYEISVLVFSEEGRDEFVLKFPHLKSYKFDINNLPDAISDIRKLNLDILIMSSSLSGDFYNPFAILLSYRLAAKQMMYCGDVVTSGIKNVDYYIVGKAYEDNLLSQQMTENILSIPGIGYFMPPPRPTNQSRQKARADLGIADDCIIYASNSHILKLTPNVISTWMEILKNVPNSKLLLMPFNSEYGRARFAKTFFTMVNKFRNENSLAEDRIIFANAAGRDEILLNLVAGDIYLDSFAYSGATSAVEAMSLHLPVVTWQDSVFKGRSTAGLLQEVGIQDGIAKDRAHYIKIATELALLPNRRSEISTKLKNSMVDPSFFNPEVIAKQLDSLFRSIQ